MESIDAMIRAEAVTDRSAKQTRLDEASETGVARDAKFVDAQMFERPEEAR
jgi:hypothetical protein